MTTTRARCWPLALVMAGAAWVLPGAAAAQETPPAASPAYDWGRLAFDTADTDGDGLINEAEMTRDAAAGFAALDEDGSGTLSPAELGEHDPTLFAKVDADGDGLLTFKEVMTNKVRAFDQGDRDDDGGLSFDEMVTIVEIETGDAS
ncbi:EF-hand domain-containing protein [Geminicoccus harenae]|uniref:EF-hand domain-containing protein n=1 Tax=Geminicoccus harenae TaxID=2498453 RepID=UPI00168B05FF|nr:EF-hand domain-containing protein [Geminicoccus harenae]